MITAAHWYDPERCRRVEFEVDYSIEGDQLDVFDITPIGMTFYHGQTNQAKRSCRVQTTRGRELLVDQLFDSGEAYNLTLSLARRHGLLATTD